MSTKIPQSLIGKNYLINGDFSVWQRNTSFSNPNDVYTADRWKADFVNSTGAGTLSRQSFTIGQTSVDGEPQYYLRAAITTALGGNTAILQQPVESVRIFSPGPVTMSIWLKSSVSVSLQLKLVQDFGSGGSPSSDVTCFTQNIAVTTAWQRFSATGLVPSISGKTLGSNADDHYKFQIMDNTTGLTYTLEAANAQLEIGGVSEFEKLPPGETIRRCQRYYVAGNFGYTAASTDTTQYTHIPFPVQMRAAPSTVTASTVTNVDSAAQTITGAANPNQNAIPQLTCSGALVVGDRYECNYTADAEIA